MADRKQHAQMITDHASVYQGASTPHHRSRAIDLYGFFYGLRAWGCLWRVDGSWCLVLTPVCEPGAVLVIAMHGSAAPATGAGNSEPGNLTPGSSTLGTEYGQGRRSCGPRGSTAFESRVRQPSVTPLRQQLPCAASCSARRSSDYGVITRLGTAP
jgi:hypothetical protein